MSTLFAATIFLSGAKLSFGLTSICGGGYAPELGRDSVKHEVVWSYHDNWFSDMFVEVSTSVEGNVSLESEDAYPMRDGGVAQHLLPDPVDGRYIVRGYIQAGYPASWGFDGYFGAACPAWSGTLVGADSKTTNTAPDTTESVENTTGAPVQICHASNACAADASVHTPSEALSLAKPTAKSPTPSAAAQRLSVTHGLIHLLDERNLVLHTSTGRYVAFVLPAKYRITRRTAVNLGALLPGHVVGIIRGPGERSMREPQSLRIYPALSQQNVAQAPALDRVPAGFEFRGLVQEVGRSPQEGSLRLALPAGPGVLFLSPFTFLALIEDAAASALPSVQGELRVTAAQQNDGSLIVQAIEILQ